MAISIPLAPSISLHLQLLRLPRLIPVQSTHTYMTLYLKPIKMNLRQILQAVTANDWPRPYTWLASKTNLFERARTQ